MAIQTYRLLTALGGQITLDAVYNDANLSASQVQYTNTTPDPVTIVVTRRSDGQQFSGVAAPGSVDVRVNVPNTQMSFDAKGRLLGWDFGIATG